jgi:hypothetical protein
VDTLQFPSLTLKEERLRTAGGRKGSQPPLYTWDLPGRGRVGQKEAEQAYMSSQYNTAKDGLYDIQAEYGELSERGCSIWLEDLKSPSQRRKD